MTSYVEYACFGKYLANSDDCLYGCTEMKSCVIATRHIPKASIGKLVEYLVSSNHSIRSRAKTRLEKLQEGV